MTARKVVQIDHRLAAVARVARAALFVAGAVICSTAAAVAQSTDPLPVQPNIQELQRQGHKFTLGETCTRMTPNQSGVIKRDACGRWYCGRPEWKDINESRPNFAAEMGCEWRLNGLHCLCQRPTAAVIPNPSPRQP